MKKSGELLKVKIKTCDEEFLEEVKRDFDTKYIDLYRNLDKKGIQELFNNDFVYDTSLEFDYQELSNTLPNSEIYIYNIKRFYEPLRSLTNVQATREELWFTMINTIYLDYLLDYLKTVVNYKDFDQKIKNAIFYNGSNIRAQLIQRISRYWWMGYRTYDEKNKQNPYWLMEFFFENDGSGKSIGFFSSKLTNNKEIALGIIEGIYLSRDKVINRKETYATVNKYFNAMGGVRILDIMTREEVKKETIEYINYIVENLELIPVKDRKRIIKKLAA